MTQEPDAHTDEMGDAWDDCEFCGKHIDDCDCDTEQEL